MHGFCTLFDDISRLLTLFHGMSRCLTLSTVYVRHLAVSVHNFAVSATQMCQFPNRVWKGHGSEYFSFIPVDLPQVPSALLLHHCRCRLWIVLYRLFLQSGCGTITRTSNAVESFYWPMHAVGRALTNYYCETWYHGKREREAKKRSRKEADIKTKFPISYFGHACPM